MIRVALGLLACSVLLALPANGGNGHGVVPAGLVVEIQLHTYNPQANYQESVQSFSVTCNPPRGVVFAGELCADIGAHPDVMLKHGPYVDGMCPAPIGEPWVGVTVDGVQMVGGPGQCDANTAGTLYYAATVGAYALMGTDERWLRCGLGNQQPSYALTPPSILACSLGLWTRADERSIQAAEQAKAIARLSPTELFPSDVGAQSCSIPAAGAGKVRALNGQCGVAITPTFISCSTPSCVPDTKTLGPSLPTVVTFVEYWGGGGLTASSVCRLGGCGDVSGFSVEESTLLHTWHVKLEGSRVLAVTQSGRGSTSALAVS